MIKEILNKLLNKADLTFDEAKKVMDSIMGGNLTPAQIAGILVALRMKKESIDEISGMAYSMREHASSINPKGETVDIVGTGGDLSHSYNISTTAAIITASCGATVAKHGNRSVSSKCGSADVLEELGVNLDLTPEQVEDTINKVGIGFMFAPKFHGAMKHAIVPRKELGVRTVFNILGPLTNPASATYEVLGVFDPEMTETMAHVLKSLGLKHALVVHGEGGLDELSIIGNTKITELTNSGEIKTYTFDPTEYGFKTATLNDIKGGDAKENAQIILSILNGEEQGAKRNISIINSAAALIAADKARDFQSAIKIVEDAIDSGKAKMKLDQLIQYTQGFK